MGAQISDNLPPIDKRFLAGNAVSATFQVAGAQGNITNETAKATSLLIGTYASPEAITVANGHSMINYPVSDAQQPQAPSLGGASPNNGIGGRS